jgi:isopentenyldiphosphate isomerase
MDNGIEFGKKWSGSVVSHPVRAMLSEQRRKRTAELSVHFKII